MLIHIAIFIATASLLIISHSLYFLGLALMQKLRGRGLIAYRLEDFHEADSPTINIVIPVFNEAQFIERKIENTAALDYPSAKLVVWVVDGQSTDSTIALCQKAASRFALDVRILHSLIPSKIHQLNLALEQIPAEQIVVVTDADTLVESKTALRWTSLALADADNGVIGGWSGPDPKTAIQAEIAYWDKQNRIRWLETLTYSSSIAVAPYYAFRRSLLPIFPDDCVADDVYVSFKSLLSRGRILYTPQIITTELRSPTNLWQMLQHKLRKANAYTIELFRVLYLLPRMSRRLRFLYTFRLFQFFYLPWVVLIFLGETALLLYASSYGLVLCTYAFAFSFILLASLIIRPYPGMKRGGFSPISILATIQCFTIVNLVLLVNSLSFPFWLQNAAYEKVGPKPQAKDTRISNIQTTSRLPHPDISHPEALS